MPMLLWAVVFGERDAALDQSAKDFALRKGLSILLPDPCLRAIGCDDEQRNLPIVGFGNGGVKIERGTARGDDDGHALLALCCPAKGDESCASFIGDGSTLHLIDRCKRFEQRRIAATGAEHAACHPMCAHECCHLLNGDYIRDERHILMLAYCGSDGNL